MADHDPLTGLLNRRKFEAELDRHVEHVKRYGPEGAVLVLDIDHFKDDQRHARPQRRRRADRLDRQRAARRDCAPPTSSPGSAATSSPCCSQRPTETRPRRSPQAIVRRDPHQHHAARWGAQEGHAPRSGSRCSSAGVEHLSGESDPDRGRPRDVRRQGGRPRPHAFYETSEHRISRTKARLDVGQPDRASTRERPASCSSPSRSSTCAPSKIRQSRAADPDARRPRRPDPTRRVPLHRRAVRARSARIDEWVATQAIELIEQHPGPAARDQHLRQVARRPATPRSDRRSPADQPASTRRT